MKNKMSATLLLGLLAVVFLSFTLQTKAQEQKVDKLPELVGGIKSVMEKVVYPEDAKKNNVEGKVFIKIIVDEKGNVENAEVSQSAGASLDAAALKAAKQCKFIPAQKDGKNVRCEVTLPIQFKLGDKKG